MNKYPKTKYPIKERVLEKTEKNRKLWRTMITHIVEGTWQRKKKIKKENVCITICKTSRKIYSTYGQRIVTDQQVHNWLAKFRSVETSLEDEIRLGRPSKAIHGKLFGN